MSETMSLDTRDDGGNYIADDDTYPRCVWFANGRKVEIEYTEVKNEIEGGEAYLTVEREIHPAFSSMKPIPYAEAKAIRRGEGELPDYEVLTGWLGRAPKTWLPALLIRIVELCVINRVFQDGGLEKIVERAKLHAGNPLRSEQARREEQDQ